MASMADNSQSNLSLSVASNSGNDNVNVLPVTPPRNRKMALGKPKPPPTPTTPTTPTTPSKSINSVTATGPKRDSKLLVSNIGFSPPTPDHTSKTDSTKIPNGTHLSSISAPSFESPPSKTLTSSPAPPVLVSSSTIKHASDDEYATSIPGTDTTSSFSRTSVPSSISDLDGSFEKLSLSPTSAPIFNSLSSTLPPCDLCAQFNFHSTNAQNKRVVDHRQTLDFYRKWTSHFKSKLCNVPINVNTMPIYHANEPKILNRQNSSLIKCEVDAAKAEMNYVADYLLGLPLPCLRNDTLLYRVHTDESKSPYSPDMGIRCSGWSSNLINNIPSQRQIDGRAFKDHCNETDDASPYISVHTSVARLVRLIDAYRYHRYASSKVFVISLNRLEQLGIKAKCTKGILYSFGGIYRTTGDDRVKYVTDSHWLVEQWVPDQAIVAEMSCRNFLAVAEIEGISKEAVSDHPDTGKLDPELEARNIELHKWSVRSIRVGDSARRRRILGKSPAACQISGIQMTILQQ